MLRKKVIPVSSTEFELDDRSIFPHAVELEDVPSPQDFQKFYDHWFSIFEDLTDRETSDDRTSCQPA
ncbi:hypothetical protein H6F32_01685 [Anabaena sp. FACHB-1237]|uniref:hypothetical protein n=1 Tax=Anabaena sp. FACHB-1237 TaxID=2692769 RepID=UPI00168059B1|nr:hypothetical protein [Anabaena sp. FACHB-1237]MBD2136322.1 hypothetical protein [Anabaena sp. FACHB-1237]